MENEAPFNIIIIPHFRSIITLHTTMSRNWIDTHLNQKSEIEQRRVQHA